VELVDRDSEAEPASAPDPATRFVSRCSPVTVAAHVRIRAVAEDATAHAENQWPITAHQLGKRIRVSLCQESLQQVGVVLLR
jgi:hypothetical protein